MKKKAPKLYRYIVAEVWGYEDADAPVKVGDILIDKHKSPPVWDIYNLKLGKHIGGWHAPKVGEYDGPVDANGHAVSVGSPDAV